MSKDITAAELTPTNEWTPQTIHDQCNSFDKVDPKIHEVDFVWTGYMASNISQGISEATEFGHNTSTTQALWDTSISPLSYDETVSWTSQNDIRPVNHYESGRCSTGIIKNCISTQSYESFFRSVLDADWNSVEKIAKMSGIKSMLSIYCSSPLSGMMLSTMKGTIVRDIWHRSWSRCACGVRAVKAVVDSLELQIPDNFSTDLLYTLKATMYKVVSEEDWVSLLEAAQLAYDLSIVYNRSVPDDYGEVVCFLATMFIQSFNQQDWEKSSSQSTRNSEAWQRSLTNHRSEIGCTKRQTSHTGSLHSWEALTEAVKYTSAVNSALNIPLPERVLTSIFSVVKSRLVRLAAGSAWTQLEYCSNIAVQVAYYLQSTLPEDYMDIIFAVVEQIDASFCRRDWFAAYTAATIASRLAWRWNIPLPTNRKTLIADMSRTIAYLISTALWDDAEQGVMYAQFIASAMGLQLPEDFPSAKSWQ